MYLYFTWVFIFPFTPYIYIKYLPSFSKQACCFKCIAFEGNDRLNITGLILTHQCILHRADLKKRHFRNKTKRETPVGSKYLYYYLMHFLLIYLTLSPSDCSHLDSLYQCLEQVNSMQLHFLPLTKDRREIIVFGNKGERIIVICQLDSRAWKTQFRL